MKKVIIYSIENKVAILYPSENWKDTLEELAIKDVPKEAKWIITEISSLPSDVTFQNAWKIENNTVTLDISKVKEIWINKFREARIPLLKALDIDFMRAVEVNNKLLQNEIIGKKKALRDITLTNLPDTLEDIKSTWPNILK